LLIVFIPVEIVGGKRAIGGVFHILNRSREATTEGGDYFSRGSQSQRIRERAPEWFA
jgi:hypothetical protein